MFPTDIWKYHFSVSSSTFMTASWMLIFVSAEPSWTILSIDRSEPRFESHTGGKVRKKNRKTIKMLAFLVNFRLDQIQNSSAQIKKMKARIFSSQMKENYFCWTLTDDARHKNVYYARHKNVLPPLDLTRILKSYQKRNDRRKFPGKIGATDTTWGKSRGLIGQKW